MQVFLSRLSHKKNTHKGVEEPSSIQAHAVTDSFQLNFAG
jgi:hypothetical protein